MSMKNTLHKTPLHELHLHHGGKMVAFAGYDMPLQYEGMGVMQEHIHVRSAAGLFDVSHMGQAILTAYNDPAIALENIVPSDIQSLKPMQSKYTVLLNDEGGIVDDLIVTRWDENTLFIVVNAGCKEKDYIWIEKKIGVDLKLQPLEDRALLALQGPEAENVLAAILPAVKYLTFMTSVKAEYAGVEFYISRAGYTGEDGFEISMQEKVAVSFAEELLKNENVKLIGLGARDSLRLEAGLCLYGHDLDDRTTPVEANLKWVIPKHRRVLTAFCGADKIIPQFETGVTRVRVGIKPEGKAPVREGSALFVGGQQIGMVTSGGFGPTVNSPVAMGYVDPEFSKPGTSIDAMVRETARPCEVIKLPFLPAKYKK